MKANLLITITNDIFKQYNAKQIMINITQKFKCKGGGDFRLAEGVLEIKDENELQEVFDFIDEIIEKR